MKKVREQYACGGTHYLAFTDMMASCPSIPKVKGFVTGGVEHTED